MYTPSVNSKRVTQFVQEDIENALKEGSEDASPGYSLSLTDDQLVRMVDDSIKNGMPLHEDMKKIQDNNDIYWKGEQKDETEFLDDTEYVRPVENRVFLSQETLIPIVTERTPEPVLFTDDENREQVEALQKVLIGKYEEDDTRTELRIGLRHWMNYRLGMLKVIWDSGKDDFHTEYIRPQRLILDPYGRSSHECRYIIEMISEPLSEVLNKFPKKKDDILRTVGLKGDDSDISTPVNYWEFHTNEIICWKIGNVLLEKSLQPFFNFQEPDKNFLREPTKPYAEINKVFSMGSSIYDDTSLTEQIVTVQDGIDRIYKNVFEDLEDSGSIAATGDFISKEELAKYRGRRGDKLWGESGTDIRQCFMRISPKDISPVAMNVKMELSNQADNIMGTHSTTRGERNSNETYGGRVLLKEGDTGRTAPISQALERTCYRLFSLWIQMIKVMWTEECIVSYSNEKGTNELIKFQGDMIKPGLKLRIKPGSMLPKDKYVERNEALELLQAGRIDDETLFERLGDPNPKESAKKIYIQNAVLNGSIMQPGFLDASEILFPGIKQEIIERLKQSGAPVPMVQALMGMPMPQPGMEVPPQAATGGPLMAPETQLPEDLALPPSNELPIGM